MKNSTPMLTIHPLEKGRIAGQTHMIIIGAMFYCSLMTLYQCDVVSSE